MSTAQVLPNILLNLPSQSTTAAFAAASAAATPAPATAVARLHSVHARGSNAASITKILHFVRHAEGTHNVASPPDSCKTPSHHDASLTDAGVEQCARLASLTSSLDVECVIVSPMTRCLQTAQLSFPHLVDSDDKVPFVALEEWRETVNFLCDSRRSKTRLEADFPHVDFTRVAHEHDPIWDSYEKQFGTQDAHTSMRESDDTTGLKARVQRAWKVLSERPERNIAVVGHSAFFMHMFTPLFEELEGLVTYEDEDVRALMAGSSSEDGRFENCELRSVALEVPGEMP